MPTLVLGDDLTTAPDGRMVVTNRPRLCARLLAYLAWPNSERDREQYLAVRGAAFLDSALAPLAWAQRATNSISDPVVRAGVEFLLKAKKEQLVERHFNIFTGGFGPVVRAAYDTPLQERLAKGLRSAELAGYRLLLTTTMAAHHDTAGLRGGPSLGKATDLLKWLKDEANEAVSTNAILEAWKSHMPVAHISAALVLLGFCHVLLQEKDHSECQGLGVPVDLLLINTEALLQLSVDFLNFGTTYVPTRGSCSILDMEAAWTLPVAVPPRPMGSVVPPLSNASLNFLIVDRWAPMRAGPTAAPQSRLVQPST